MTRAGRALVVAVVAAWDRADTIGPTVSALVASPEVDDVVVVDDGSTDATAAVALAAGARVLHLRHNGGKGDAVAAGLAATPEAEVYLLIDADVGSTASAGTELLKPVLAGEADMAVGVLPSAGGRGGLGLVRRLAKTGIQRATRGAFISRAPLSGQRAVRADLLQRLDLAPRFGLETALTIDAVRAGARVVEIPVAMDHRHTGRGPAGFAHRAGQGADVARALWPRVTSAKVRTALIVASLVAAVAFSTWSSGRWEPESVGPTRRPAKVLIFGVSRLGWDDIGTGVMPNLDALIGRGALAAMSVRTLSSNPSVAEGYATLGAGSRVKAPASAGVAFDGPGGTLTVAGARAAAQANDDLSVPSLPGALGDALRGAGRSTAVINNADSSPAGGPAALSRPAGLALMDRSGRIDSGAVDADALLTDGPTASGMRVADPDKFVARTQEAMSRADVVLVDPGEIDRAAVSLGPEARRAALNGTDAVLGRVMATVSPDALVLVVGVTPAGRVWHLTPVVATGAGVVGGYLHSPSTKRLGLITLTDIAPTVLHSLGALVPPRMVGHSLRYHPGRPDLGRLTRLDRDATYREGIYFPITLAFIVFNAVVYISAIAVLARRRGAGGWAPPLRAIALAIAAFPLATFLFRAVPGEGGLGDAGWAVLLAIDVAIVALARRARRRPLSPLAWILGSTTWLLIGDIATGARLQVASIMGYSPHTAARFFGIGNTAFAALAASAILGAAIHLDAAPRRREALVGVAAFFALVAFIDGAPALGDDVGGILTLVPIFGLTLVALSGKRLSWRKLVAAVGLGIVVVAVAAGVDLLRAPEARTHLGRLVADVSHNGPGTMFTTVARKTKTNLRVLRGSVWTWTVPIVAGFMLYVLVWQRRWTELLPPASARRTGVIAALAAGLLGFALNDSGVIVTAVVLVYVGPFLTLLALEGEDRGTVAVESSPLPAPMAIS